MSIADEQREFYEALFREHGNSPRALSYRDRETQYERFERLTRVFGDEQPPFRVHEIGCGLGHLGEFLESRFPGVEYSGSDISETFVEHCRRRFPGGNFQLRDVTSEPPRDRYDFILLSGAFNPRLGTPPAEWQRFVFSMLEAMYRMADKGLAANFLSTYHDPDRTREDLHYQDPQELTDFVVRTLSRHYALDAAGPLYEYSLVVYRPDYVESRHAGEAFRRYFHRG